MVIQGTPDDRTSPPIHTQGSLLQHVSGRLEDFSALMSQARARQGLSLIHI